MIVARSDPKLPVGSNKFQCASCSEFFGGIRAFEIHRAGPHGDRRCLTPSGTSDKHGRPLLGLNSSGYWVRSYGKRQQVLEAAA